MPAKTQVQDPFVENQAARELLLKTAQRMRTKVGRFGPFSPGETTRIKLLNVGIITRLRMIVEAQLTGSPTQYSLKAPYNLIETVKLIDFDGQDRISASAFMINELSKIRYGMDDDRPVVTTYTLPVLPTSSGTLKFVLDIPVAYDPEGDLRGAILAQVATGELYLQLKFNSLIFDNMNDDALVKQGSASISNIYVHLYQEYLMPVPIQGVTPIPSLDVSMVYELNGSLKTTDNIQNGVEKLINFPNVRSVYSMMVGVVNNKQLTWDLVNRWRILTDANTTIREYQIEDYIVSFRHMVQYDPTRGIYYINCREKPIETAVYGQVQLGMFVEGNVNSPYMEVLFESFYSRGVSLQGFVL